MLISMHIPKTAGITFQNILSEIYGFTLHRDYGDQYSFTDLTPPTVGMQLLRIYRRTRLQLCNYLRPSPQCIHGHCRASKYLGKYPNARFITWLREPVERVISHYYYWKRNPDSAHTVSRYLIKHNLTLEEFAELDVMQNLQAKYLDGIQIQDYWFLGIQEHFDRMIQVFFRNINVRPIIMTPRNLNPDKLYVRKYPLSEKIKLKIARLNTVDRAIYDTAVNLAINKGWL